MRRPIQIFLCCCAAIATLAAKQPLVVVSVDGLDNRYLANADQMGLKIPNLRRLMREGQVSKGVIGVVPTVTWPSHTTMITGVDPVKHGILANWRPPGEKYLDYSQIKVPTLIGTAHAAGLTIATINWPVTVDAPVDWNIPEYFSTRRGAAQDRRTVESKSKPADLFEKIAQAYPSFPQQWMDDRNRTQAAMYLLQHEKPQLLLIHLADLDSEEHDNAPYTREAKAIVERSDELIGQILSVLPAGSALAVVSDHGFEKVNTTVDLALLAKQQGITNLIQRGGIVVAPDEHAAEFLRQTAKDSRYGIGREIGKDELAKFPSSLPPNPAAAFEPADGFMFSPSPKGEVLSHPEEIGNHGHWPMRYRAVFILWGNSIPHETLPEFSMKDIAGKLARVMGVSF
jgi:predicted AlkP superfamily pyrophosphatase or phosphodiesterase